ncbi:aldo/keto reductase [Ilumatobacter nonamiensis]|uniref:aldo/keto reductase n=1 Tax=Ilumatobacter nonamiensis TaxID=467093 RepID=UPI00058D180C|nr:aldo/keto reductase [Ilumatobacter nonamiensis]
MSSLVQSHKRSLGSLPPVGPIAYGLWRFTDDDIEVGQGLLETALESGMNLIDTADVYGFDWGGTGFGQVEEILGQVLAATPGLRDRIVLATKGGIAPPTPYDSSPKYLRSACEASLRRLQTDVIDLYQIHRPDMYTHPADVAITLHALRVEGKIREVGVSNHTPAQVAALQAHLEFPIITNQPEFSAVELTPMRDGTLDQCMAERVTPLAWSPLGGGRLATGEGIAPDLLALLDSLAVREGVDRSQIALAFVLAHPSAPVAIIGSQNPDRIRSSAAALGVTLDRADVYAIVQASEGVPLP